MTGDAFTQLCVGGIFALLVIREVLGFLSKRKNGVTDYRVGCQLQNINDFHTKLERALEQFHEQHNRNRERTGEVSHELDRMTGSIERLEGCIDRLCADIRSLEKEMQRICKAGNND